jgi:hypothetical protein
MDDYKKGLLIARIRGWIAESMKIVKQEPVTWINRAQECG